MTPDKPTRTTLSDRRGNVAVYATAAGLASAVPIPFLDTVLASSSRGAAMRRIAKRHGVSLSADARRVLRAPGLKRSTGGHGYRFVRTIVQRFALPIRAFGRVEDAFGALASAALFDHYLTISDREPRSPLEEAEAVRVRAAIDAAVIDGLEDIVRFAPSSVKRVFDDLVGAATSDDGEGRSRYEAILDTLLDAFADAPEDLFRSLVTRFEQELASLPSGTR